MARKLDNWLLGFRQYVEETESPRNFWSISGIFMLSSVMQRKVWLDYGISKIFPNMYVLIVGPPACRKGPPVTMCRKFLQAVDFPVFSDSPTKRLLTKALAESATINSFRENGVLKPMSYACLVSPEFSSLLAVNPKEIIELLTDLWDCPDKWEYRTSEKGEDLLYNVYINAIFASTPTWIARNLPAEAIGGGFTSRILLVYGNEKYKSVAIPKPLPGALQKRLISDLGHISQLSGEFKWAEDGGKETFEGWYGKLGEKIKGLDERLHSFVGRMHVHVLKTAMCLRVAYSDQLLLTKEDLKKSIQIIEGVLLNAGDALGSHGGNSQSQLTEAILRQIKLVREATLIEILQWNYKIASKQEILSALETIVAMGYAQPTFKANGQASYTASC